MKPTHSSPASMVSPLTEPAAFGPVLILPAERRLLVQGQPAALGARAFDLLLALAARRERVVTKDELLDLVWPGLVVEENNLAAQISALRKVLGAQAIGTVPGRGYRFTLAPSALPAQASPAAASATAAPGGPADTVAAAQRAGAHLLLADDNKVNRLLLCRTLELQGWQVSTADNGRKALDMLRQQPFALLLLDLEMPELDGFALLQQRAEDPALGRVPVIVTSSLDGVGPLARCFELGADDYLHKPVNASLLKARVGACLERRQLREERETLLQRLAQAQAELEVAAHAQVPASGVAVVAPAVQLTGQCQPGLVLVLRLLGLEALLQAQAPEDSLDVLNSWHTLMVDVLEGHSGQLQQAGGDHLVALFPHSPQAAAQARQAAQEAAEMLALFNAERQAVGRLPIALGAGLAAGEVLLGRTGTPQHPVQACLGAPVQRAWAQASQAAAPGHGVLLDEAAAALLKGPA